MSDSSAVARAEMSMALCACSLLAVAIGGLRVRRMQFASSVNGPSCSISAARSASSGSSSKAHGVNVGKADPELVASKKRESMQSSKSAAQPQAAAPAPATQQQQQQQQPRSSFTVVAQRVNSASLLVDNKTTWHSIQRGLVFHVSFAQGATSTTVRSAAKTLLSLPIMTSGEWGDGNKVESILKRFQRQPALTIITSTTTPQATPRSHNERAGESIASTGDHCDTSGGSIDTPPALTQGGVEGQRKTIAASSAGARPDFEWTHEGHVHVMVIPQASLSGKLKNGKLIQYHGQLPKAEGRALYVELLAELERQAGEAALANMFRSQSQYAGLRANASAFDKRGVPTLRADGSAHDKASKKVVEKQYAAAKKWVVQRVTAASALQEWDAIMEQRIEASSKADDGDTSAAAAAGVPSIAILDEAARRSPLHLVAGTYGNRQGLKLDAELGPFTHVFRL